MQQIILKTEVDNTKMNILLQFLHSLEIEAEIVDVRSESQGLSLSVGIWNDYEIDSKQLRNEAWGFN